MSEGNSSTNDGGSRVGAITGALKRAVIWVALWLKAHLLIIAVIATGIVGMLEYAGVQTGIPPALAPYTIYLTLGVIIGYYPAQAFLDWVEKRFGVPLHDVDPGSGDAGGYILSPERWNNITVEAPHSIDSDGELVYEEVGKDALHKINTKLGVGYECTRYDNSTNTARTSWMAGASPTEVRAFKMTLKRVETTLSILADLGIEESINRTPIVRAITEKLARYMVRTHQQGTIPNGDEIDGVVSDVMSEQVGADWQTLEDKVEDRLPEKFRGDSNGGMYGLDNRSGGEEQ
ncbi:hypothetical protein [Halobaculum limi]|uniref:hypothetical protein n=1 Tax=Halobaculum limi TaxID=3031916 RepID=UPI002406ED1C|nr:hypothetical protein [Halobaculum sp. YSMS11]